MRCWEIKTCRKENRTNVVLAFIRPSLQGQIIWFSFILVLCTSSLFAFLLPPGTIFSPALEIHIRYICHNIDSHVVEKLKCLHFHCSVTSQYEKMIRISIAMGICRWSASWFLHYQGSNSFNWFKSGFLPDAAWGKGKNCVVIKMSLI